MEQKFKLEFKCKILRVTDDGFTGLDGEYLIRFQDKKLKHLFEQNSEVLISMESADQDEIRPDHTTKGYSVIYVMLSNYLSNGIQFSDVNQQKGFFWNYRGIITNKFFESNDLWEKDSIIRILIKRFK